MYNVCQVATECWIYKLFISILQMKSIGISPLYEIELLTVARVTERQ